MAYEIELIRKEQLEVVKWSGGTTTQLAIFPKDAVYSERNFKWRLSSAKVEVGESLFTSLPNTNRIIMIIEGELILEHEGHHKSNLKPFDQDHFHGSWKTKSFGKVTDFNLMMSEDCEGKLEVIHLEKEQSKNIAHVNNQQFLENVQAIYCVNGQVKIEISTGDIIVLCKGDIILIRSKDDICDLNLKICNEEESKVDLIRACICC
ncbi:HutD/Ves family protein [Anaerosolibacter sp.]|uniref:HutD/Ves family protein n=1 Tax=Anaerosolibacter sp. TaxID=1872527 RepID=UPI0039EF041F